MGVTMSLARRIFIYGFITIATICCHSVAAMQHQLAPVQQQYNQSVCLRPNLAQQFRQQKQMCPIDQKNNFQYQQTQAVVVEEQSQLKVIEDQIKEIAKTRGYGNKAANLIFLQKILNNKELQQELKQKGYGVQVPSIAPISHKEICDLLASLDFNLKTEWSRLILSLTPNQINETKETKKLPEEFVVEIKALSEKIKKTFYKAAKDIEIARAKVKGFWKTAWSFVKKLNPYSKNVFISQEVQKLLELAQKWNKRLMVRSTGQEDTKENSNAGGNESVANVPANEEEILRAIGIVVASYFSERSLSQRFLAGDYTIFDVDTFVLVLIQVMVGEAEDCTVKIQRTGMLYGKNLLLDSQELVGKQALDAPALEMLEIISRHIEDEYGQPMDIELVYDPETKTFFIAQVRPIISLSKVKSSHIKNNDIIKCFEKNSDLQVLRCIELEAKNIVNEFFEKLENESIEQIKKMTTLLLMDICEKRNLVNLPIVLIYLLEQMKRDFGGSTLWSDTDLTFYKLSIKEWEQDYCFPNKNIHDSLKQMQKIIFKANRIAKELKTITKKQIKNIAKVVEWALNMGNSSFNLEQVPLCQDFEENVKVFRHVEGNKYVEEMQNINQKAVKFDAVAKRQENFYINESNCCQENILDYNERDIANIYLLNPPFKINSSFPWTLCFLLKYKRESFSRMRELVTKHEISHIQNFLFFTENTLSKYLGNVSKCTDKHLRNIIKSHLREYHSDINSLTSKKTITYALRFFSELNDDGGSYSHTHPNKKIRFFLAFLRALESFGYNEPF
jgi:hypothetical protein